MKKILKKKSRSVPPASGTASAALPAGRVRIIGGQYRRTPVAVVAAPGLRPTPDRVRETVFNWLEHLRGNLAGSRALDLFAGTGVLGFEMASRGASHVTLVESNALAAQALRSLQARLAAAAVTVVQGDWQAAVSRLASASFDVIFLDPPFDSGILERAVDAAGPLLAAGGFIYVEGPSAMDAARLATRGLEIARAGRAGVVYFHLLRAQSC